ncbi:MAG: inositol monophosphatase family protein [Candidatus Marinimicrobia bacterium]|nr:inositol monophosphatase family protein [Candidatus Neomarinimicrobiota bacterium]|tara:strand:- start:523 stop:1302 length:780 start_codon:yes stop_codon:yes gene_type:complete
MGTEPNDLLNVALEAAEKAASFISAESLKVCQVDYKGKTNLVTQADRGSEEIILDTIRSNYPNHNIITEESAGQTTDSSFVWIVDPLDGTTNFVHSYPFYAVSIAVYKDYVPQVGVILDVYHQHTYSATAGGGAHCNGKPIRVTDKHELLYSLLATGFKYEHDEVWEKNFDYYKTFTDITQGVRRAGAAALDLAHVACGWLDGLWEYGLNPWDAAAGVLIVEEAGGKVTKTDGSQFSIYTPDILATNGRIHGEMLTVFE